MQHDPTKHVVTAETGILRIDSCNFNRSNYHYKRSPQLCVVPTLLFGIDLGGRPPVVRVVWVLFWIVLEL